MKKYFFMAVAAIAALSSCSNNDEFEQTQIGNQGLVFTATMEGAPETRATYDGTYKCASWEVDDRISINGFDYKANNAGTSTTFSPVVDTEEIRPTFVSSTNTGSYKNQPAQNLVDEGGVDTRWIANKTDMVNDVWNIVVTTGKTTQLKSIKLWNADNQAYPKRRWKSMKVYGSISANGEWTEIGSFANLNLEANKQGLAGEIAVNATDGYKYYRIDVLDNEGDAYMQMSDMKFVVNPAANAPYDAYFPASLYDGTTAVLPTNITETWADGKFNMPMYAHSENTELQFKNLCGVLKITVKSDQIAAVKKIRVSSANKATSGEFTVNSNNAAVLVNPNAVNNTVTMLYDTAVPTTAEGTTFYVAVPAQTYQELKIDLSSDVTFTKGMTTKSATDITVVRNTIYPITFVNNSTPLPAGALKGVFSISNDDGINVTQIYFSQGNLWYGKVGDAQTATFNFEANQYDTTPTSDGDWDASHVSHFYWSKASDEAVKQNFTWDQPMSADDVFFTNDPDDATKPNVNFTVNVGGKEQSGWRTLSTAEWQYLFKTDTPNRMVNGKPCYSNAMSGVTIGGATYKGIFLYPDDYSGKEVVDNTETWTWDKINSAGIVFLPAAGYHLETNNPSISNCGDIGNYWSSTPYAPNKGYAGRLFFNSEGTNVNRAQRKSGFCVRLVTEVK